ncbi:hypothetical protein TNCV_3770531 [Trichonephila clavipes]|nr:hypothetical protein TNCV_3770531 [Trichonephila clavipes]
MNSLGHSFLPPTASGRQDDEEATPGDQLAIVVEDLRSLNPTFCARLFGVGCRTCRGSNEWSMWGMSRVMQSPSIVERHIVLADLEEG